jgi:hypothetical protein
MPLSRRELLLGTTSALCLPELAWAGLACSQPDPSGLSQCSTGIRSEVASVFAGETGGQHMNQWCWAACIEMIFRYYGLLVKQERIVAETFGGIVNMPAQPGQILSALNRPWIDDRGVPFRAVSNNLLGVRTEPPSDPVAIAAHQLAADAPLIIGTQGHAMVLSALTYMLAPDGRGQPIDAKVRDPWPNPQYPGGLRSLSGQEFYGTTFLAWVAVQA